MRVDQIAIQNAQRAAFDALSNPKTADGKQNPFFVNPKQITLPAVLIQEQQLTTAANIYTFDFSMNAPAPTTALGNVQLGQNNVACVYGIQILTGEGANANTRVYRSYGPLNADDVIYRGTLAMNFETSNYVQKIHTSLFREQVGTDMVGYAGMQLINPLRFLTGRLGTYNVQLQLPALSALTFTSNLFISVRLHIALGAADA